jgi:hypothetical protein
MTTLHLRETFEAFEEDRTYSGPRCGGNGDGEYASHPEKVTCLECLQERVKELEWRDRYNEGKMRWTVRPFWSRRVYEIRHYYDYATTEPAHVAGWFDPSPICAYLQFRADREICEDSSLTNEGLANILCRSYGYKSSPGPFYDARVDLYLACECRCGRNWANRIWRLILNRPGISKLLPKCVDK